MDLSAFSYQKFVQFAFEETQRRTTLSPRPIQENLKGLRSKDGNATLHTLSFEAPKIRHIRSLSIEGGSSMQVLDFAAFPELKFDFPIFCANFFTTSTLNIIVLDLNPLYDATLQRDYKEKYYRSLLPLYQKYAELLPWGDKITSESLKFFSPIVIWSKINSSPQSYEVLYATFKDYFKAWLVSMELAVEAVNEMQTVCNCEAQHKYLAWRAEKDPGHPLLKRLIGENLAREMIRHFLFEGVDSLGTKTFLDYFPEYHCEDGSINQRRSIIGKAYKTRPWDAGGEFIGSKVLYTLFQNRQLDSKINAYQYLDCKYVAFIYYLIVFPTAQLHSMSKFSPSFELLRTGSMPRYVFNFWNDLKFIIPYELI